MSCAFLIYSKRFHFIKVIQRLEFNFPEKDVSLDPVRKESFGLIRYMLRCWNSEYVIKFFESPLFRFFIIKKRVKKKKSPEWWKWDIRTGHQEEYHDQCTNVQSSVETKSTCISKGTNHTRESYRDNRSPEKVCRNSPWPDKTLKEPNIRYIYIFLRCDRVQLTFPSLCGSTGKLQPSTWMVQVLLRENRRLNKGVH